MKEFNVTQGTPEWAELRAGVPTASEFGQLLTPELAPRTGETPKTYLFKKLAEYLTGPLPSFGGNATDQGHFLEPEAIARFEFETGIDTRRVGFVMSDDGRCGCSPDGMIGTEAGVEIKSPGPVNAVRYYLDGTLPDIYAAQVHGSMFVTNAKEWHFFSYHRKLPPLHLVIKRDEAVMERIRKCLAKFHADFDAALDRLEPKKKAA